MNRHLKEFLRKATAIVAMAAVLGAPQLAWATPITLAGWDFNGYTAYGLSPAAPNTTAANLTVVGLTRGIGVATGGTAAGSAWGGTTWDGKSLTFSFTADAGYQMSFDSFANYNVRRSNAGATGGQWQYQVGAGEFTNIGSVIVWGGTSSTGNSQSAITLSGITALQNVTAGSTVTFRLNLAGGTTGTWYLQNFQTGNDFSALGTVIATGGGGDAGTNYYWVGADTTLGGTGTWAQAAGTAWQTTDTDGAGVAWDSAKIATFGGDSAGTVTVSDTVTANAGLSFATTGYTLTGGTISLGGANAAANTITTATATAINSVITGSTGLTKGGVGALTLGGANTYSGGTTVSAGSLIGTTSSLQGAITNNAAVTFDQATGGTYAGIMSGSGSLTKLGAGNVTLSGANTYSGGTTVSAGSLVGTTSSLQGAITNNAAVTFDQATGGTYAGIMSGSGSLTKLGTGNVTLSGANTYSGATTVSAGTLSTGVANAVSESVSIASGATFSLGAAQALTSLTGAGTLAAGSSGLTLAVASTNTFAGTLTGGVGASLAKSGPGTLNLTGTATGYAGSVNVSAGGITGSSFGTGPLTMTAGEAYGATGSTIANAITIGSSGGAGPVAALQTWNFFGQSSPATLNATAVADGLGTTAGLNALTRGAGAGASLGNNSFRTTGFQNNGISTANTDYFEWKVQAASGEMAIASLDARFIGTSGFRESLGVSAQFAYSLDGSNFTLIGSPFSLTADTAMPQISLESVGALQNIAADTTVTFRYYASGQTTTGGWGFSSPEASDNGLVLRGSLIASPSPATARLGINEAGSTLFSGNVAVVGTAELFAAAAGTATFSGAISGESGAVTKLGAGTVVLSGSNTYSGGTTVSAGTLSVAADAALGGSAGGITLGGGTLEMTSGFTLGSGRTITAAASTASTLAVTTGTVSYGGAFTGSGDLDKIGAGRLSVSNASSGYTGLVTISAGTLEVTGANAFANATLSQTGGTLLLAPAGGGEVTIPDLDGSGGTTEIGTAVTAVVGGPGNSSYNGQIRGQGALRKEGGGVLTLNGNNDFAGNTRISEGRLKLGNGGVLSATPLIEIDSGAIFDITSKTGFALGSGQRLGGRGTILGNLEFGAGSQIAFDPNGPMLVGDGVISFAAGFGIGSIVGLDSSVAEGTYTLLDDIADGSFSLTNLANFGAGNAFDLGGGKSAYFYEGSLQVIVVPEPDAFLVGGLGLAFAAWGARRRERLAAA